jgi:hypothetical protein
MALNPHWDAMQKMIEGFLELYPEAEYEFAHIVLSDYNLGDDDIESVLAKVDYSRGDTNRIEATERFLQFLLTIPEDWRMPGEEE